MRNTVILLVIFVVAGHALAGSFSSDPFADPFASNVSKGKPISNAHVIVPADTREATITIISKQRTLPEQLSELIEARTLLRTALAKAEDPIGAYTGEPSLKAMFSASSKSSAPKENSVVVTMKYSMPEDVLLHTKRIVDAVAGITVPEDKEFSFKMGRFRSLIAKPEAHREKLIEKALVDLEQFKKQSQDFTVTVADLENPLDVRQKNEKEFIVSLYYTIELESKSADKRE